MNNEKTTPVKWVFLAIMLVVSVIVGLYLGLSLTELSSSIAIPIFILIAVLFVAFILWNLKGTKKVVAVDNAVKQKALLMQASADETLIYVYRQGFVGKLAGMNVSIDDVPLVQLKGGCFSCVSVPPGTHVISGTMVGGAGAQSKGFRVSVQSKQGEVIACRLSLQMGMIKGGIHAEQVADLSQVKQALSGMKMVAPQQN